MDDWREKLKAQPAEIGVVLFHRWPDLTRACGRYLSLLELYSKITPELRKLYDDEVTGMIDEVDIIISIRQSIATRYEKRVRDAWRAWWQDVEVAEKGAEA